MVVGAAVVGANGICGTKQLIPPDTGPQGVPAPKLWLQTNPVAQVPKAAKLKTPVASHGMYWLMLKQAYMVAVLQTLHWP